MEENKKEMVVPYATLRAKKEEHYNKLVEENEYFVPASYEETQEGLKLTFDTQGLLPWKELRKESLLRRYATLLKATKLFACAEEYGFEVRPANLYYSLTGEVRIKMRDLADEEIDYKEHFLRQFKALCGYTFQKKYSYDDYYKGGESLLKKNKRTAPFLETENLTQMTEYLTEQVKERHEIFLKEEQLVSKKSVWFMKLWIAILGTTTALGLIFAGVYLFYLAPYYNATEAAMKAYIDRNHVALIDSMKPVSMQRMSLHHKKILSEAYVNGENLSMEQKENILLTLSANQNEKVFDYWIYIGRLDAVEAENIAMQLSDEELLVYAYLLERKLLEKDTGMDGEEKNAKIKELDNRISEYTEKIEQMQEEQ